MGALMVRLVMSLRLVHHTRLNHPVMVIRLLHQSSISRRQTFLLSFDQLPVDFTVCDHLIVELLGVILMGCSFMVNGTFMRCAVLGIPG